eukprot:scaffold101767_cov60-Phaeocystis_antarctica.AAC.9
MEVHIPQGAGALHRLLRPEDLLVVARANADRGRHRAAMRASSRALRSLGCKRADRSDATPDVALNYRRGGCVSARTPSAHWCSRVRLVASPGSSRRWHRPRPNPSRHAAPAAPSSCPLLRAARTAPAVHSAAALRSLGARWARARASCAAVLPSGAAA